MPRQPVKKTVVWPGVKQAETTPEFKAQRLDQLRERKRIAMAKYRAKQREIRASRNRGICNDVEYNLEFDKELEIFEGSTFNEICPQLRAMWEEGLHFYHVISPQQMSVSDYPPRGDNARIYVFMSMRCETYDGKDEHWHSLQVFNDEYVGLVVGQHKHRYEALKATRHLRVNCPSHLANVMHYLHCVKSSNMAEHRHVEFTWNDDAKCNGEQCEVRRAIIYQLLGIPHDKANCKSCSSDPDTWRRSRPSPYFKRQHATVSIVPVPEHLKDVASLK